MWSKNKTLDDGRIRQTRFNNGDKNYSLFIVKLKKKNLRNYKGLNNGSDLHSQIAYYNDYIRIKRYSLYFANS